ncbi:MAG: endonuclease/exonuclease/phosphatase family protein [Alphaproteobacteria bacterium]
MSRIGRRALIVILPFLLHLASGMTVRAAPIELTVMTQNLYVGADTRPLLEAPDLPIAEIRVAEAFQDVVANDFPARAAAIASRIQAAGGPLLIGLQEASIISGGGVTLDYAQILQSQLAALGLDYTIAGVHEGSSVALAGFSVTDRDIVLARTGVPGFTVTGSESRTFANNSVFPTVLGPISADRGYVLVDAMLDSVPFQFVSTHLESFIEPVRLLQAQELLTALSTGTTPQLLVGDFNANPAQQTYQQIVAAGFVDTAAAVGVVGPTCCQDRDLSNPASGLTSRFDYIFARDFPSILSAFLVSDTPFQMVRPLWPSDHAGVVATVAVPEVSSAAILAVSMLLVSPFVGFGVRRRYRVPSAAGQPLSRTIRPIRSSVT